MIVLDGDTNFLGPSLMITLVFSTPGDLFGSVSINVSHEIDTLTTLDNWLRTFDHTMRDGLHIVRTFGS